MDFKGQQLSEKLSQYIIVGFAIVAFLLGYALQSFSLMITIFTSGVGIAFVLTALDWPIYNRNPVSWRRPTQQSGGKGGGRKSVASARNFWNLFR